MTPLQAYLKSLRATLTREQYSAKLDEIAEHCYCTKLRLSQASNPRDAHILPPASAMYLELYTFGIVPAESVCPAISDMAHIVGAWTAFRKDQFKEWSKENTANA